MTSSAHSPFKIGYARVSTNTQDEAASRTASPLGGRGTRPRPMS